MIRTLDSFLSHCKDNVVVHIWSSLLGATEPFIISTVGEIKADPSLFRLEYFDFRISSTHIAFWCRI